MELKVKIDNDLRRDLEDMVLQIQSALVSVGKGYYATARAELRGAIIALDRMDARSAEQERNRA